MTATTAAPLTIWLYTFNTSTGRELEAAAVLEIARTTDGADHNPASRAACCQELLTEIGKRRNAHWTYSNLAAYVPQLEAALQGWR